MHAVNFAEHEVGYASAVDGIIHAEAHRYAGLVSSKSYVCERTLECREAPQVGAVVLRIRQHERRQQAQNQRRLEGRRLVRHHDAQHSCQVLAVHLQHSLSDHIPTSDASNALPVPISPSKVSAIEHWLLTRSQTVVKVTL